MNREAVKAALLFMLVGLVLGGIIGYGVSGRGKATDYVSKRDTSTYIDTECSLSEGITASGIPLEVLVANIDAPLWTCKNKDVGQAT